MKKKKARIRNFGSPLLTATYLERGHVDIWYRGRSSGVTDPFSERLFRRLGMAYCLKDGTIHRTM